MRSEKEEEEEVIEFQISSDIYKNILVLAKIVDSECTIKINNREKIQTSLVLACAIFTKISNLLSSDSTTKEFNINVQFINDVDEAFYEKIENVLNMEKITFEDDVEIRNFAKLGISLGCDMFLNPLRQLFKKKESKLTIENTLSLIKEKVTFNMKPSEYQHEIQMIAEKFEDQMENLIEFAKERDDNLYFDFFSSLLEREHLELTNEDQLVDLILQLIEINNAYGSLLKSVCLEYCSNDKIQKILKYADTIVDSKDSLLCLTDSIKRLMLKESREIDIISFYKKRMPKRVIYISEDSPLNGIFKRNYNDIKVDGYKSYRSMDIFDDSDYTNSQLNNSFTVSFQNQKPFIVTKYMIRGNSNDAPQLKIWKLEGKTQNGQMARPIE